METNTKVRNMTAAETQKLLVDLDACSSGRAGAEGKTLREIWRTCERGDCMLWLLAKMEREDGWPDRKVIVLAACDCAELALKDVLQGENRPRKAFETARKWARGKATLEDVESAAYENGAYAAAEAAAAACDADAANYAFAYAYLRARRPLRHCRSRRRRSNRSRLRRLRHRRSCRHRCLHCFQALR